MTTYGDNPQQPNVSSEAYIPDQLIAGDLKLVTRTVTITGGAAFKRGAVLGLVMLAAAGAPVAAGGNTGNGTITAVTRGVQAKVGTYTIEFTGATTFNVIDPDGQMLTPGLAAGAYVNPQIGFTFTAGGTAMVAGDKVTIAIAAAAEAYTLSLAAATDGSQTPASILVDDADASGGDVKAGIYEMGEFNGSKLILGTGITLAAATAALRQRGIFIKDAVSAADPT